MYSHPPVMNELLNWLMQLKETILMTCFETSDSDIILLNIFK